MIESIILHEVGLRDGLQIEKEIVPFETKLVWAEKLIQSGVDVIQLGSFVNPAKVPQMADTDKLFKYFNDSPESKKDVLLSGLVLNEKGLDRGLDCGVDLFCMGVSASDTHSKKNTGMSREEALEKIIAMGTKALDFNKKVQVSVQSAFGCGFEGTVPEETVINIVKRFIDSGFKVISLADTAGHADPEKVERLFGELQLVGDAEFACHFHNTYGLGLANCYAALNSGVKYFESAFGGLGGCPFTKLSGGNVATDDLVHLLHRMNVRKDISLDKIIELSKEAEKFFNREMDSKIYKTGSIPS
jgi:hydroxymethylglutaryl-CoA lyase